MKSPGLHLRLCIWLISVGIALATGGCIGIFLPKYKVLVDAISAPDIGKPTGKSYRLMAKKATLTQVRVDVKVVEACLDAALVGTGMFKAPSNVPPDLFIEVAYGTETAGRSDPSGRETFLQLSARDNPSRSLDKVSGTEQWDVRVAVLGLVGRVEAALPLLSAVAATNLATNTHMETKIEIPQNAPMINSVREAAVKTLEAAAPASETGAAARPAASAAVTPVK